MLRVLVAVVALSAASCVLPLPPFASRPSNDDHRAGYVDPAVARLTRGVSTRVDVLLALGEPDLCTADERRFAYVREVVWMTLLLLAPGGAGAVEASRHRAVVLDFDEVGILSDWRFVDQSSFGVDDMWLRELGRGS